MRSHLDMLVHLRCTRSEHFGEGDMRLPHGTFIIYPGILPSGFAVTSPGFVCWIRGGIAYPKKRELTLQEIMGVLGKLETFIRNTKMNGKTTSRFALDYFPRNRAWKAKSWKGCFRMWRFERAHWERLCQGAYEIRHDGKARCRGAEVRDWRRNGPDDRTERSRP